MDGWVDEPLELEVSVSDLWSDVGSVLVGAGIMPAEIKSAALIDCNPTKQQDLLETHR